MRTLTTASALLLSSVVAVGIAVAAQFSDVPSSAWYAAAVEAAVNAGVVSGYKDAYGRSTGRFGPENAVTIGEALKISLEGAGYDTSVGIGYGHWAAPYMSVALGYGFDVAEIQGLNLDRPTTRAELASLIADAFKVPNDTFKDGRFIDVTAATPYAGSIEALAAAKIISGDTDSAGNSLGTFRPFAAINRAETVKLVMTAREELGLPGRTASYSSSSSSSSSATSGTCKVPDCGPAPQMPNWECPDGTVGGPSCERLTDGRCGWIIRQCPSSSSSSSKSSSSSSHISQTFTVKYTSSGWQPSILSIHQGDVVKFHSESDTFMWVASNPHPTHGDYPEFDERTGVAKGVDFYFTFNKIGTWGYHNHNNPNHQAVIIVDPN